jgi:hypothetical protein
MILAAVLVAINVGLWLAQGGLALPASIFTDFFGGHMVRAEVVVQAPDGSFQDYFVDRGVITSVSSGATTTLSLREKDGHTTTLQVDASTAVRAPGGRPLPLGVLRRRVRIVAFRLADASTARTVVVEGAGQ